MVVRRAGTSVGPKRQHCCLNGSCGDTIHCLHILHVVSSVAMASKKLVSQPLDAKVTFLTKFDAHDLQWRNGTSRRCVSGANNQPICGAIHLERSVDPDTTIDSSLDISRSHIYLRPGSHTSVSQPRSVIVNVPDSWLPTIEASAPRRSAEVSVPSV